MIKFPSSFKLKEIHKVESLFNEDPKNIIFSKKALISEEGRPKNLGKMGNNRDIYCYANREVVNFERAYKPPWYQNPCDASISYMPDQILGKNENRPRFDLSLGSSPPQA